MAKLENPTRATFFVARDNEGTVVHEGVTPPNNTTETGQPVFKTTENEIEHIIHINEVATSLEPLPAQGTELSEGEIFSWNGKAVKVRQSHTRTEHDPDTVPALFLAFREDAQPGEHLEWIPNENVQVGMIREFEGTLYEVIQAHATQEDWTPPSVPALWQVHIVGNAVDGDPWRPFEAVTVGMIRTYEEVQYVVLQAHTTQVGWEPPNVPALWSVHEADGGDPDPAPGVQEWSPDSVSYSIGDRVMYQGTEYECIQNHTSQAGWDPATAASLWTAV